MLIDCDRCPVRGSACGGCVVSALFEAPARPAGLRDEECRVIEMFERAGIEVDVLAAPAAPARRTARIGAPRQVA